MEYSNKAAIIDFIDNDSTVKNLKHRWATWPLNK